MRLLASFLLAGLLAPLGSAQAYEVTISFTNMAGADGVALSPIFIALQNGSFNPYTAGTTASSAIVQLAEMGSGTGLGAQFTQSGGQQAEVGVNGGIYLPGQSGSITLNLDPTANEYLSFYSMVVPSNDRFIGETIQLFDSSGNFLGANMTYTASAVWDAGAVASQVAGAAFLTDNSGGNTATPNGVITADDNFAVYGGHPTAAGYTFSNLPTASSPLINVSAMAAVPVPGAVWLFGSALTGLGWFGSRRKAAVAL
jgi:Spondin_N